MRNTRAGCTLLAVVVIARFKLHPHPSHANPSLLNPKPAAVSCTQVVAVLLQPASPVLSPQSAFASPGLHHNGRRSPVLAREPAAGIIRGVEEHDSHRATQLRRDFLADSNRSGYLLLCNAAESPSLNIVCRLPHSSNPLFQAIWSLQSGETSLFPSPKREFIDDTTIRITDDNPRRGLFFY